MKKILAIAGGPVRKLDAFSEAAKNMDISLTTASFSDLSYKSYDGEYKLFVKDIDVSEFEIIYIRVVGKRIEDASLLANYAKKHGIRVVDRLYMDSLLLPSSVAKSIEMAKLIEEGVRIPKTIYGSLNYIGTEAKNTFGFPYVIKSTTGKKAREVWIVDGDEGFEKLYPSLRALEKSGAKYFAQEFLKATLRYRVFVLGGEVFASLAQPTKWRKRFSTGEVEKGLVETPEEMKKLAVAASDSVGLEISGVDILKVDETGELLVIEANAAPSWKLVEKYTGKNMAEEILLWLTRGN